MFNIQERSWVLREWVGCRLVFASKIWILQEWPNPRRGGDKSFKKANHGRDKTEYPVKAGREPNWKLYSPPCTNGMSAQLLWS
jgi:hypothetical protein